MSATIFLERAGIDLNSSNEDLKERLKREVDEMTARNEEFPQELLRFLEHL